MKISSGTVNTVALAASGEVWTFGSNKYGQLGRASEERQLMAWQFRTPKPIPGSVSAVVSRVSLTYIACMCRACLVPTFPLLSFACVHYSHFRHLPAFRATDVALGGYHTLALIAPVDMQLMQHAADGNVTGVH